MKAKVKKLTSLFLFSIFLFSLCLPNIILVSSFSQSSIHYFITINNDGSATWKLCWYTSLKTSDDVNSFQSYLQGVFQKNREALLKSFIDSMKGVVLQASSLTKRKMLLNNFNLSAYIITSGVTKVGVVEYSFVWYNFSKVVGNTIAIGDVFNGGFYLSSEDSFTIIFPRYFEISSYSPSPSLMNSTSVTWNGPLVFKNGTPSLVLRVKQASLTISSDKSSASPNEQIIVSGSVDPSFSGLSVVLSYTSPDGRVETRALKVSSSGSFSDAFSPSKEGEWKVLAKLIATPQYSILSNTLTITVVKPFYEEPLFLAAVAVVLLVVLALLLKKFIF
ncbi:MAG: DUF7345 domain-containing protein [Thermoproteota archaeon]